MPALAVSTRIWAGANQGPTADASLFISSTIFWAPSWSTNLHSRNNAGEEGGDMEDTLGDGGGEEGAGDRREGRGVPSVRSW